MTLLRRLGNKQAMAAKLLPYFPPHDIYIEPFFGAGGMFFNKPRAKHNFLNDNDDEVFNLYMVVLEERERLKFELSRMPVHQSLWRHWKTNIPEDRVLKAVRFLFYSNFGYMGKPETMDMGKSVQFSYLIGEVDSFALDGCAFGCSDFEAFVRSISFDLENKASFIYADPPYLNQVHNYQEGDAWNESELARLFDVLEWRGCKFAVSEFDNPIVIQMAKDRGLQVHIIGERQNMKNRRVEILITNYEPSRQLGLF
jgi:DNA adenine methylase